MKNDCNNCYYSIDCGDKWKQCIDYIYATQDELLELITEHKKDIMSVWSISDYDEQDKITRELLKKSDLFFKKS